MATPQNIRGAIDLSELAAARKAQAASAEARAAAPAGVIIDVTEATFEPDVMARSHQVPVIVDFWATWCAPCRQLSPILEKLAAEFGGQIVLAKVDSDANQRLAAAFQVQSIPSVYLVLAGQVQPLFQGAQPEPQVRQLFEQVIKVAAQAGLQPASAAAGAAEAEVVEPPLDPRIAAAYDAIEKGDWPTAKASYQQVLNESPADEDAKAGLLQVELLERTEGIDPVATAAAVMAGADDRLRAADALLIMGQVEAAFDRLLAGVQESAGEERNRYRDRLLEYFTMLGDAEEVRAARRRLTNALF